MGRKLFLKQYDASHPIYSEYTYRNKVNYHGQKSMAKKRKVDWDFTFHEWIEWWVNTGHFHERGVTNDKYQMCRYNDVGPYSPTNVYCDTGYNNKMSKNPNINRIQFKFQGKIYDSISDAIDASGLSRKTFYKYYVHQKVTNLITPPYKNYKKSVQAICISSGKINIYAGIKQLKNAGFDSTAVHRCCQGERQTHKGHKFQYV